MMATDLQAWRTQYCCTIVFSEVWLSCLAHVVLVREVDLHRQVQSLLLHGPSGQQKLPVKQSALPPIRVPPVQVDSDLKQVQDREWAKGEVKRNRNPARHGHEQTLRRNRSHTAPAGSVRSSTGTT